MCILKVKIFEELLGVQANNMGVFYAFSQPKEAESFLLSLSEEIQRRLEAAGVKGKRLTLKVMVRKPGAPIETAKFGGHGICDHIAR